MGNEMYSECVFYMVCLSYIKKTNSKRIEKHKPYWIQTGRIDANDIWNW